MNCKECSGRIGEYVNHTLDSETSERIQTHMKGCSQCASLAEELARTAALVAALPRAGAPAGFEERLKARMLAQQVQRIPEDGFWSRLRELVPQSALRPVLTGALLCASIAGSLLFYHGGLPNQPGRSRDMDWSYISTVRQQHERYAAINPLADESTVMLTERSLDINE